MWLPGRSFEMTLQSPIGQMLAFTVLSVRMAELVSRSICRADLLCLAEPIKQMKPIKPMECSGKLASDFPYDVPD